MMEIKKHIASKGAKSFGLKVTLMSLAFIIYVGDNPNIYLYIIFFLAYSCRLSEALILFEDRITIRDVGIEKV